jgi:tetratricopeptide (TPR) repeat protein
MAKGLLKSCVYFFFIFFLTLCDARGAEVYSLLATRNIPSLGIYNLQFFQTSTREDESLRRGYNYLTDFRFQEALVELKKCIAQNPHNPLIQSEAYAYIGYCHLNLRNGDLAKENLQKSLKLNKENELSYFFLANEYLMDGDNEKVKNSLKMAVELYPNFVAALRMLAEVYKDEGDMTLALSYYQKLVGVLPNSGYYRFQLYRAYFLQGSYAEAEEQLIAILKLEPDFVMNYARLGEVYLKQQKYDKALEAYGKLIGSSKNAYLGHMGRAQVYLATGKLKEARKEGKTAATLAPDNMEVKGVLRDIKIRLMRMW